jgi:drug/metabolite transporter (DMT)-like permease
LRAYDWARLIGLALIWSLQYIFLRVAVPVIGVAPVAEARALFGALFLVIAAWFMSQRIAPLEHWKDYLAVSVTNNALPFICFAWAAAILPASYLSIINGTLTLWAALFAAWLLKEPLTLRALTGFALGLAGVALIVKLGPVELDGRAVFGVLLALAGAALWGWGGIIIKQRSGHMPPIAMAAGSQLFAATLMFPFWGAATPPSSWTPGAVSAMLALGLVCSGAGYILFFTLVRNIGPVRTLVTGFTTPVLGVFWGWLLLDEVVTLAMLAGVALVVAALALVLKR